MIRFDSRLAMKYSKLSMTAVAVTLLLLTIVSTKIAAFHLGRAVSIHSSRNLQTITSSANYHFAKKGLAGNSLAFSTFHEEFKRRRSLSSKALVLPIDPSVAAASMSAIAKLLCSVGLGFLAAKQPNLLDATAIKVLSRLIYYVFQPSFLLCSVAKTITDASSFSSSTVGGIPHALLKLLPLVALVQISLTTLVGTLVAKLTKLPDSEARDAAMCTAFQNSGPLPLVFAQALFARGNAINGLHSDVAACISFYLLGWSPLFWTFGPMVFGIPTSPTDDNQRINGPAQMLLDLAKVYLSPPVIGALLGIAIGSIPGLRNACLSSRGLLSPLYSSLDTLATAYIPGAILVLAGSLASSPPANNKEAGSSLNTATAISGSIESTRISAKAVLSIAFSRFCVSPLIALSIVKILNKLKLLHGTKSRASAIVTFVILVEGCMPPAQNTVILLQLGGLKERANKMAKTLALIYSAAVVPITILLSVCLALSGIMNFS